MSHQSASLQKTRKNKIKGLDIDTNAKKAKCGHVSYVGRYFKCEACMPELPEDDGEWTYFTTGGEE